MKAPWIQCRVLSLLLLGVLSLCAAPREKARRITVLEFQNVTRDKTLDWIGTGIKEHLTTQLSQIPELVVVERSRLGEALKELNFNRSQYVDPATAQKMGKILGVQSVVLGSYQKLEDAMRINARLVEVETGEIKAPATVDGSFKKLFDLENEVAKKLVAEMKGALADADRKQLETTPTNSLDANRLLSEGVYFLRNDLNDDAISRFDQALHADPNYSEAWFYKGLALQKRQKWDEAAAALKNALPRSTALRNVKWSWQVPFEQEKSERGVLVLMDMKRMIEEERRYLPPRVIFGEKTGNQTVLYFANLERKTVERFPLDDPNVILRAPGMSSGPRAIVQSALIGVKDVQEVSLTALDPGTRRTWRRTESLKGGVFVILDLNESLLLYYPSSGKWIRVDPETGKDLWQREGVNIKAASLTAKQSAKHGLVIVGQSLDGKLRVLRVDTGQDVWSVDVPGKNTNVQVRDGVVVAADPEGGLAAFDLDTGRALLLPALEPGASRRETGTVLGSVLFAPALLRNRVLYLWTRDKMLTAVEINPQAKPEGRVLWRSPMENTPQSFEYDGDGVYVATQTGDVFSFDARTGKPRGSAKLSEKPVTLHETGKGVIVAASPDAVYGVDPASGHKKWEYANKFIAKEPRYFKGAVVFRSSAREVVCLDSETGAVLWQNSARSNMPTFHITGDSLFVADEEGVKEFSSERPAVAGIPDKEVYTELARTGLRKGDSKEAQTLLRKVLGEIDSNYAPARLVEARLLKEQGDLPGAARDLSAFLMLEGSESRQAREVIDELKKNHGLLWQTDAQAPLEQVFEIQGKIISRQGTPGEDQSLSAFDRATGRIVWKHPGERLINAEPDFQHGRVFYLTGRREKTQILDLFAVSVDSGERRKVATLTSPREVNFTNLAYSGGMLYADAARMDLQTTKITMQVTALNAESGKIAWEKTDERSIMGPPPLWFARENVLLYSVEKELRIVEGATGKVLAQQNEPNGIAPVFHMWEQEAPKDVFYYADGEHVLVAYDLAKKQVLWRGKVPGLRREAAIFASGIRGGVLYDWDERQLFAVRVAPPAPVGGELQVLWKVEAGSGQRFQQAVFNQGRLFARRDETILELDPATGKVLKEHPLLWEAARTHINQNTAYVFSTTGKAYALSLGGGTP